MAKWWLANWRSRLAFASRNPGYAIRSVFRDMLALDERFLARVTGAPAAQVSGFLSEPFQDRRFQDRLQTAEKELQGTEAIGAALYAKRVLLQYAIVRAFKPDLILETGIANGVSSAYVLLALDHNQKGVLHSIDVDDGSFRPAGKGIGWIVPDWLRSRWTMHLGDARTLLPQVLAKLGLLDVFIHDSAHTYEHMKFEYEEAYPHIRPGGILISDDALWNPAFPEFVRTVKAPLARVLRGIGVLQKPPL
ncbi:MAG TPA: class I SAM-dependent methyltransferase [Verrucomicrobiae bacterium]|nr:class I SAM-dependent methyltransferase [Verrucomicrobiae bacterium]